VNLFIGSTIKIDNVAGTNVEMIQKTDYPWSGKVNFTVNPATEKRFTIYVRSPKRSVSELYTSTPDADGIESISVNGEPVASKTTNGYVNIERTWKPGDNIELVLPMKVQRVKCIDSVAANRGRVALRIGPLIYSVERADGNNLDAVLDPHSELTSEWAPELLGGVMIIKGKFTDGSPLVAVPYFARNNRIPERNSGEVGGFGPRRGNPAGQSTVWIRDE
jgi:uncharacterized protein